MNWLTRSTLIVLRLAIGCHFLIEGMGKIQDPAWTSAPFLREATGPLAPRFQEIAGDPVVEYFAVRPLADGEDPAQTPPHTRMPPALDRVWNNYFNQFVAYYLTGERERRAAEMQEQLDRITVAMGGSPDDARMQKLRQQAADLEKANTEQFDSAWVEQQRALAEKKLNQQKDHLVLWMLQGSKKVKTTGPGLGTTPVDLDRSIQDQLHEYQAKRQAMRALEAGELSIFHRTSRLAAPGDKRDGDAKDDPKAKYLALKADATGIRTDLLRDLAEQNEDMKKALLSVLPPPSPADKDAKIRKLLLSELAPSVKAAEGPAVAPPQPVWRSWQPVQSLDWLKHWGWAAVGLVLMCGALAQIMAAMAGRTGLGWFGGIVYLLALAGGGLLVYQFYQGWEQLRAGLQQPEWIGWFFWWSLGVVGAILIVNTVGQIVGHPRDWGRMGGAGWLAILAMIVLGAALLIGTLVYLSRNWHWENATPVEKTDWLVIWGVTMVGVCLLLGFLTRTVCIAGALLLVMFVLPAWPETMQQAGPFVKNLIEGLALVTLATTHSGRWLGIDGALQFLNPWRWTASEPVFESPSGKLLPVEG
jgi:uncharacterized membrane protein YphA (DoxX/SURF4 family)